MREEINDWMDAIEKQFKGKRIIIEKSLATWLAGGHLLIEDKPGVGKTTLAKAIASCTDLDFKRVQFTSDLLPTDITGSSIFDFKSQQFKMIDGPVFTHILLADEINRGTPKTQSALLEAMQEFQVTTDGVTKALPRPFFVIATQNPQSFEGTYPLPEAQLDRFMCGLSIGYPSHYDEISLIQDMASIEKQMPFINCEDICDWQAEVQQVHISAELLAYMVSISETSRQDDRLRIGISPRGTKSLATMVKSWAWLRGRSHVIPEDIQTVAMDVLSHRILLKTEARNRGQDARQIIRDYIMKTPIPRSR